MLSERLPVGKGDGENTTCRLCRAGFPITICESGVVFHYGTQALGMIHDTLCESPTPPASGKEGESE